MSDIKKTYSYEGLCRSSQEDLERVLRYGVAPAFDDLAGWEFRGYNVNPMADLAGIRKFKKGFYLDPGDPDLLWGYNVKVRQNGFANPWVARLQRGEPVRHGLFQAYRVRLAERDNRYPGALMLNYGLGHNPLLDVSKTLRDYLVRVQPGDRDLLLGKGYFAVGPLRLNGGFFLLERYNKVL